jgi:Sodium/hydrogen exchanger family
MVGSRDARPPAAMTALRQLVSASDRPPSFSALRFCNRICAGYRRGLAREHRARPSGDPASACRRWHGFGRRRHRVAARIPHGALLGLRKRSRRISCFSPACFWRWVRHLRPIARGLRRLSVRFWPGWWWVKATSAIRSEDDVRPFRDVLLGLFFVTVGMEIDPSIVAVAPWAVIVWVVAFLPGKVLATLVVAAIMRWPAQAGIRVAVVLAHGGEFGLLLLTQAMAGGIIEPRLGQPVLVGLVLTMARHASSPGRRP